MATRNPSISVIIPCYNQGRFLREAIDSVMAQSVPASEILVVDDGSTDDTAAVARSYGPPVTYTRIEHSGPSRPRNAGISMARGDLIQFLDADDVLMPRKFEQQTALMTLADGPAVAYCDYRYGRWESVWEPLEGQLERLSPRLDPAQPLHDLARRWESHLSIPIHTFLFDARIFRDSGVRLDERLPNHVDWDCWMQVAALPVRWMYVDEVLAIYRDTPHSLTKKKKAMRRGFVAAIEKQLRIHWGNRPLREILLRKRYSTTCYYDSKLEDDLPGIARPFYRAIRRCYRIPSLYLWKAGFFR